MTEACTLVSLLIVVCCLHAFGPHTTAMARGSLTARAPELVLSVEKVLCFQGPAVCWSAEYVCFSWMGTQGSHPPPLPTPVCLCLCGYVCVYAHMCRREEVVVVVVVLQQQTGLISDIKQSHISGRKQTELAVAPRLHFLQVHASRTSPLPHKDIESRIEKAIDGSLVISGH